MQLYPAMKARMGDWDYYIVRMTMKEVANEVRLASDLWEDRTLSDAIQRVLNESRVKKQIVEFLSRRDDRFFASIVVAAIGGNPTWTPIQSRFGDSFGELSFQTDPRYYALDGQHRLKGIKELMDDLVNAPEGFQNEQLSVIVVVREHQAIDDRLWLQRYRRLFSSLNRYAKPTDPDTNIIMDEDDVFAIVTRRLITDHDFFKAPYPELQSYRVQTKNKNVASGQPHFTSLQTLYQMNETLLLTAERRKALGRTRDLTVFKQHRPEESEIDDHFQTLTNCWDAILQAVPELHGNPAHMRTHDLPDPNPDEYRDHLLFWPIGQELFADVARALLNAAGHGDDADVTAMAATLRPLADVPWALHAPPWRYLLLVSPSEDHPRWRIRNEDRKAALEVAARLIRWFVGLDPLDEDETAELRKDWQQLLYLEPPGADLVEQMWQETVAARGRMLAPDAAA